MVTLFHSSLANRSEWVLTIKELLSEMPMKILIAVDGSDCSTKATTHIASHLDWFRDPELHLLHVQSPIPTVRARAVLGEEAIQNYYNEEAKAAMASALNVLQSRGISVHSTFVVGDVAQQIDAYAKKHGIDTIVMGSRGHGALASLVLGSTAMKVLATTSVPVLIVR